MTLYRTLLVCLFLVIFSNISIGAEVNKDKLDPELRDALIEGFTKLGETLEKADPKDIEAFQTMLVEPIVLFYYLSHCLDALPTPKSGIKSMNSAPWPSSLDIKLKYPLTIKTEIVPKDDIDYYTILFMRKKTTDAPWKITDGWLQSKTGEKSDKVAIPSPEQQKKANDALLRLMTEKDQCKCEE